MAASMPVQKAEAEEAGLSQAVPSEARTPEGRGAALTQCGSERL